MLGSAIDASKWFWGPTQSWLHPLTRPWAVPSQRSKIKATSKLWASCLRDSFLGAACFGNTFLGSDSVGFGGFRVGWFVGWFRTVYPGWLGVLSPKPPKPQNPPKPPKPTKSPKPSRHETPIHMTRLRSPSSPATTSRALWPRPPPRPLPRRRRRRRRPRQPRRPRPGRRGVWCALRWFLWGTLTPDLLFTRQSDRGCNKLI